MSARKPPNRLVALDWDARNLRVVLARVNKKGVKVERLLSARIPPEVDPSEPEQMGGHIRSVLQHERISTKSALVDIPRDQAVLNTLHLPAAARDELPGMVQIQIAKELSFPVSDAVVDFTLGPRQENGTTVDVLVAAVRKEVVQQYEATLAAAGLKLDRIGLRPHASKTAICSALKDSLPERLVFIDVRPTFTEVDVLREGHLAFSRAASVMVPEQSAEDTSLTVVGRDDEAGAGLNVISGPSAFGVESAVSALLLELTRSVEAYRAKDPGAKIDHVVIGGDTGVEERLAEVIAERLDITTEIYNPASTFGWGAEEGASAAAFTSSLGLVLGQVEEDIQRYDFLHPKQVVSQTQERLRKAPLVAAVVVLFIAVIPVFLYSYTAPSRNKLARVNQRIEELEGKENTYDKFLELVEELDRFDQGQYIWVDLLYQIMANLPSNEQLVLESVAMDLPKGEIRLKTRAKTSDIAHEVIATVGAYCPAGDADPLFRVDMGEQKENAGEVYPWSQDLVVALLPGSTWGESKDRRPAQPEGR